jgi:hypothetical protein
MEENVVIHLPEPFIRVVEEIGLEPKALLYRMIGAVIALDADLRNTGLAGLSAWCREGLPRGDLTDCVGSALGSRILPSGFMWPSEQPFPWTDRECAAAVRGYKVKWRGSFDDFVEKLPGVWEMDEGFASLRQP